MHIYVMCSMPRKPNAVYVIMLYVILCYAQFSPDFGPMLGGARCSGRGQIILQFGPMPGGARCSGRGPGYSGLRSDVGRGPVYVHVLYGDRYCEEKKNCRKMDRVCMHLCDGGRL